MYFCRRPLPPAARVLRRDAWRRRRRSVERIREAGAAARSPGPSPADLAPLRERFFAALADDFNTPKALARCLRLGPRGQPPRAEPTGDADLREMLGVLGAREPARRRRGRRRARRRGAGAARRSARRPARRATSPRPTACATSCAALGWEVRDARRRLRARARADAVILYGRNPVREALRGAPAPRVQRGLGDARRRRASRGCAGARRRDGRAREELERRCGSTDHQGICAEVARLPLRRRRRAARARPTPLIVALDEVQDPQNLGAICRTAECAGATGVVIPERRAAEVTPAVCKASAGAVEHLRVARVRNLADFLGDAKDGRRLVLRRRRRRRRVAYDAARLHAAASCSCSARRAAACARASRRPATSWSRCRCAAGSSRSTSSAAAAALLYEILQKRDCERLTALHNCGSCAPDIRLEPEVEDSLENSIADGARGGVRH